MVAKVGDGEGLIDFREVGVWSKWFRGDGAINTASKFLFGKKKL